jgi:hypothetical protein
MLRSTRKKADFFTDPFMDRALLTPWLRSEQLYIVIAGLTLLGRAM